MLMVGDGTVFYKRTVFYKGTLFLRGNSVL